MMAHKKPNAPKNSGDMFKDRPVATIERLLDNIFDFATFRHGERPKLITRETLVQLHEEAQDIGVRTILE